MNTTKTNTKTTETLDAKSLKKLSAILKTMGVGKRQFNKAVNLATNTTWNANREEIKKWETALAEHGAVVTKIVNGTLRTYSVGQFKSWQAQANHARKFKKK